MSKKETLFRIDKKALGTILSTIRGGVGTTGMFSISNIGSAMSLVGHGEELSFLLNTGRMGASCAVSNIEIAAPFDVVFDFTMLFNFVNLAERELLVFEQDGAKIIVSDGDDKITLVTIANQLVQEPEPCDNLYATLKTKVFQELISKPLKVTGSDVLTGILSQGVMFYGSKAVATTREHMVVLETPYEDVELPLFVPRDVIREFGRITGVEEFDFKYNSNSIRFEFEKKIGPHTVGQFALFGLQLDRSIFPDYSSVTDKDYIARCVISPKDMLIKANKLRILDKDKEARVKLFQVDDDIYLRGRETLIGNDVEVKLSPKEVVWSIDTTPGFKLGQLVDTFSSFNPDGDVSVSCLDDETVFCFKQGGHSQYLVSFGK